MADIIRLTADQVRDLGSKFAQAADDTQTMLKNLESAVQGASAGWEGDAYNSFVETFEDIRTKMNDVVTMYDGIDTMLQRVVQSMQEADSDIAGAIRSV